MRPPLSRPPRSPPPLLDLPIGSNREQTSGSHRAGRDAAVVKAAEVFAKAAGRQRGGRRQRCSVPLPVRQRLQIALPLRALRLELPLQ